VSASEKSSSASAYASFLNLAQPLFANRWGFSLSSSRPVVYSLIASSYLPLTKNLLPFSLCLIAFDLFSGMEKKVLDYDFFNEVINYGS